MYELIGWVGSILFALCALPQAWLCFKQKHARGISWLFLMMWLWGEVLTFTYVLPTGKLPLLANYVMNFILLLIIIFYKVKGEYGTAERRVESFNKTAPRW